MAYKDPLITTSDYEGKAGTDLLAALKVAHPLALNLDKLHTTEMGVERIKRNLNLDTEDPVAWCRDKIRDFESSILRKGKNWYIEADGCQITVNANSYTIITAHKLKKGFCAGE